MILKEVVADFELGGGGIGGSGAAGTSTGAGAGILGGGVTGMVISSSLRPRTGINTIRPIDTLASLLTRTSGLLPLPQGFFGTLGVGVQSGRGDLSHVSSVLIAWHPRIGLIPLIQTIDQALRKACESVIHECTTVACQALTPWLSPSSSSIPPLASPPIATPNTPSIGPSSTPTVKRPPPKQTDQLFQESCKRDLHGAIVKMKLYLNSSGDNTVGVGSGTAGVLVHHVRERVVEGYREFLDAVAADGHQEENQAEDGLDGLMGVVGLGEVLGSIIEEVDASGEKFVPS